MLWKRTDRLRWAAKSKGPLESTIPLTVLKPKQRVAISRILSNLNFENHLETDSSLLRALSASFCSFSPDEQYSKSILHKVLEEYFEHSDEEAYIGSNPF